MKSPKSHLVIHDYAGRLTTGEAEMVLERGPIAPAAPVKNCTMITIRDTKPSGASRPLATWK